jgi:hypothetical protein
MKTKSARTEGTGQFVSYIEHASYKKQVVRITVRLGGYASQSWGVVERWDGAEWREVVTVKGEALLVDPNAGYKRQALLPLFAADRARLVQLATEVL